ncbi:MAG: hypothetical protein J7524_05705 [Roseofilum sp. Belize BBD 4]|uniref:hypothetical protein n=1 Tax=Roseofilum sp. Belize BBD 4 TaxID=2821500 RepID=UPI000E87BDDD|nr:hypothetical protein [Roseofilum sp. Belize BBD 4]MBP0032649.1 hypothetical protein [Roseofilum sp. Belize BBD 4]HBQ98820.1 hypothetical protein [Cyanobacteria bacterium UBA11691]
MNKRTQNKREREAREERERKEKEDSRTSDKSAISIAAIFDKLYLHQKLSPIQLKTISHAEERTARVEGIPLVSNRITTGWLSRVCSIMEIGNPLIKD